MHSLNQIDRRYHMTEFDFKLLYNKLCINYGKNMNTDTTQTRGDMLFERYSTTPLETFRKTLELVMERHGATYGFFPSIKEISACMSEVISSGNTGKKYKECSICNKDGSGIGAIGMIFVFDKDREKILERHIWSLPKEIELREVEGVTFNYNVCCRCEAGQDLYRARGGVTYQLTEPEYNKLLAGVHETAKGEQTKLLQEEIPF
tara:strand:- start:2956 stop:3570 length:615 start_codon:yes stop_codon:yes gene_type:complete